MALTLCQQMNDENMADSETTAVKTGSSLLRPIVLMDACLAYAGPSGYLLHPGLATGIFARIHAMLLLQPI